jgi:hypothetical protein
MSSTKEYTLDLHGYTVLEAVELADKKVREAWAAELLGDEFRPSAPATSRTKGHLKKLND